MFASCRNKRRAVYPHADERARQAVKKILAILAERGYGTVCLFTDRDNLPAQGCYRKCGFTVRETLTQQMSDGTQVERVKMICEL